MRNNKVFSEPAPTIARWVQAQTGFDVKIFVRNSHTIPGNYALEIPDSSNLGEIVLLLMNDRFNKWELQR